MWLWKTWSATRFDLLLLTFFRSARMAFNEISGTTCCVSHIACAAYFTLLRGISD